MNLEFLMKQIEHSTKEVLARRPDFTGSITLQINFLEGKPHDIIKEVERVRIKIPFTCMEDIDIKTAKMGI